MSHPSVGNGFHVIFRHHNVFEAQNSLEMLILVFNKNLWQWLYHHFKAGAHFFVVILTLVWWVSMYDGYVIYSNNKYACAQCRDLSVLINN
jgi:cytochrome c1